MSGMLLLAMQVAAATQLAQATLTGTIRDAESGRPLVGATVTLVDMHRSTRTSDAGAYVFHGVPAGPQHIAVRFIGHAQRTLHALVPHNGLLEINVSLVAVPTRLTTLEVRPAAFVPGAEETDSRDAPDRAVSLTAVRNYPQLIEPDVFLALGGGWVHARAESPSGLHIRGGATDQTAYLLDGVPVFSPYHTAGVFSGWNPDAIARLELSGSAPRVTAPHALSGTVSAVSRTPADRVQSLGTASTSHARATIDGPLGSRGAGFLVSGRGGYPTIVARKDDASYQRGMTGDWLGKIEVPVRHGRLRLLGYLNENELHTAAIAEGAQPVPDSGRR
ncbi:MAG: carboxypeptidase regulatory-like domain-containing protein, partial [Gemmatimonadaceae bacterium]